jgi:hypothetical protein
LDIYRFTNSGNKLRYGPWSSKGDFLRLHIISSLPYRIHGAVDPINHKFLMILDIYLGISLTDLELLTKEVNQEMHENLAYRRRARPGLN